MNDPDFQKAYEAQNRRDQIANSTLATVLSIILNLSCSVMDYFMYPEKVWLFFKVRIGSMFLVALTWVWFKSPAGRNHHRLFGVMWYASPLAMILWMIYAADDPHSPYYAGLNIVLLAVGLLSPWTYIQNLISAVLVLAGYLFVVMVMETSQPISVVMNNTTFLVLTAVIVVFGSVANARQRFREFGLRWELDKSRRVVEESNRKLVELDQIKNRFFANISHELRTPLTLLLSPLETMQNRRGANFDDETKTLFGIMHSNGMRLLKLINDLLDLVRLESGRMEVKREPMEMTTFIRSIASAAQQMADNKGVTFEISVVPDFGAVMVDRDKLEKVVLNLVFNALKFTPKAGRVELRAAKENDDFVLTVADSGIGIAAKNLPFIFDRFWQADGSSKRSYKGVGIGLSLVKELTEIHGGKVSVESEEGKGTKFTVRIPYLPAEERIDGSVDHWMSEQTSTNPSIQSSAPAEAEVPQSEEWLTNLYRRAELFSTATAPSEAEAPGVSRNGDAPNILIADDESDMLRFLRSQLKNNFSVTEASDGKQAVEKALQTIPDIILLDMNMPEKDGLQVCRELREQTSTRNIPIVMLTARADEETKLAALSAGANDFLAKPFSTTELHVRIKNLLDAHKYQGKLAEKNSLLEQTIEQLKQTEMQLVQTEKMASLGRMSAGIIHEINNPLNYAATGLYTLRNKGKLLAPEEQSQFAEVLTDVEEGIDRVKNIVLDLQKFTHPDDGPLNVVEVLPVVNSALRFLSGEWKERVKIEVDLPEKQVVFASQKRLLQVFINLLQNALDALKGKSFVAGEEPTILIRGKIDEGKSIVRIRDNGTGIAETDLNKIFDPFFTTKEVGEGMGLGLSICFQIVHEYGGKITVASEPGKFTEFSLEFPEKR